MRLLAFDGVADLERGRQRGQDGLARCFIGRDGIDGSGRYALVAQSYPHRRQIDVLFHQRNP